LAAWIKESEMKLVASFFLDEEFNIVLNVFAIMLNKWVAI
jgi:hypothetical protein